MKRTMFAAMMLLGLLVVAGCDETAGGEAQETVTTALLPGSVGSVFVVPPIQTHFYVGLNQPVYFAAGGGVAPYRFFLVHPSRGVDLWQDGTCLINGYEEGHFRLDVIALDGAGTTGMVTFGYDVTRHMAALYGQLEALPPAAIGQPYNEFLSVAGGTAPYAWLATPGYTWPSGITFQANGGPDINLTGTPTAAGDFFLDLTVVDFWGEIFRLQVALPVRAIPLRPLAITISEKQPSNQLPDAFIGLMYRATIQTEGGSGKGVQCFLAYPFQLPGGLKFNDLGGGVAEITGDPTDAFEGELRFAARDSEGLQAIAVGRLKVLRNIFEPLRITPPDLTGATQDVNYEAFLEATGGTRTGYTFSIAGLPGGLQVLNGPHFARVFGQPAHHGGYNLTISVRDSGGNGDSLQLMMQVETIFVPFQITNYGAHYTYAAVGDPAAGPTGLRFGTSGLAAVKGGTGIYTFRIVGGTLPMQVLFSHLELRTTRTQTAMFKGDLPSNLSPGTYSVIVRVTDGSGVTDIGVYYITLTGTQ
ncbi:MAG: hypothetical protein IT462_07030 [Planctomycetes bacterium]|nr:hypothetical protein [Planctomycetota bacterium]